MESWRFVYNVALSTSWPLLWLYYRLRQAASGKYASSYRFRLGLWLPPRLGTVCSPVWIHALSVGEVLSAVPLVHQLRVTHPQQALVFSVATEKGFAVAQKEIGPFVTTVFYLPHDHLWNMTRFVRHVRPAAFILVETDLWPNLLWTLKKRHVPVLMVNARLSLRSFSRLQRFRPLSRRLLASVDRIYVQSKEDARRFAALGVPWPRLRVAGNLKFDLALFQKRKYSQRALTPALVLKDRRPLWIAGSTHDGEEATVLKAHKSLLRRHPRALLVLAPRHVERGPRLAALCEALGLRWAMRSRGDGVNAAQVLILDSIGELAALYPLAQGAFIGGSLVPFGGHNPLEAAVHGVPCCWGPYLDNFREIESFLLGERCGRRVTHEKDMLSFLLEVLDDRVWPLNQRTFFAQRVCDQAGAAVVIAQDVMALAADGLAAVDLKKPVC
ncbi:MAG: 3-deoxy-D-manno-octulosonic acid transferase [Desulfosoma sp.]|uniref:3-deoxy-D-manno-octulosonic acid transferase n=1 Tax=Desulfosoma sp. TaxID=2603217 RepID=UPI004049C8BB